MGRVKQEEVCLAELTFVRCSWYTICHNFNCYDKMIRYLIKMLPFSVLKTFLDVYCKVLQEKERDLVLDNLSIHCETKAQAESVLCILSDKWLEMWWLSKENTARDLEKITGHAFLWEYEWKDLHIYGFNKRTHYIVQDNTVTYWNWAFSVFAWCKIITYNEFIEKIQ